MNKRIANWTELLQRFVFRAVLFVLISSCALDLHAQKGEGWKKLNIKGLDRSAKLVEVGVLSGKHPQLAAARDSLVTVFEIVKGEAKELFSIPFENHITLLKIGDANQDGKNELLVATGKDGYAEDIDINLYAVRLSNGQIQVEKVYNKKSERPHSLFLDVADLNNDGKKELILSYFESKYFVETVAISRTGNGKWEIETTEKNRMAMVRDIGKLPGYDGWVSVVGRPYGDTVGALGDAYILTGEKSEINEYGLADPTAQKYFSRRQLLPAFRGVKAVHIADFDKDGKNEIFIGDGWHMDYGKVARSRLAMISHTSSGYKYELIEDVKGQYEITQIDVADINGDGRNELLARGNRYFRIYTKEQGKWKVFFSDSIRPAHFVVADINGDKRMDVVFAGKNGVTVYNFGKLSYTTDLGKEIKTELIDPKSLIGKPAPELVIDRWMNGSIGGLKDLKGKVVLLDFWATWCKPCIKMFPTLNEWQEKYERAGLVVIGLTRLDNTQDMKTVEEFVENAGFAYMIGVAEESFNNLNYGVGGIPHMVLIDRKGMIRKFEVGANDGKAMEEAIKELLNEKP